MNRDQIEAIIAKYRRKSHKAEPFDEEESYYYTNVADAIEGNLEQFLDESFETEDDVLYDVREILEASDVMLDIMFDRDEDFNDDDDGIGSILSKD